MSTSTQPGLRTIRDTVTDHVDNELVYWFDQDLTIDELRRTVAVINEAMRSSARELAR